MSVKPIFENIADFNSAIDKALGGETQYKEAKAIIKEGMSAILNGKDNIDGADIKKLYEQIMHDKRQDANHPSNDITKVVHQTKARHHFHR